jgi:hypothetical protein
MAVKPLTQIELRGLIQLGLERYEVLTQQIRDLEEERERIIRRTRVLQDDLKKRERQNETETD